MAAVEQENQETIVYVPELDIQDISYVPETTNQEAKGVEVTIKITDGIKSI